MQKARGSDAREFASHLKFSSPSQELKFVSDDSWSRNFLLTSW